VQQAPTRVGLIGYGFAGKTFHAPLIRATAGLDLVAVASRDPAKVHVDLGEVAVVNDPLALARSDAVDLVVIASPNASHAPLAAAALAAGKHVVVDKPFTLDLDEARALATLAQQRGTTLSVFHNRRWDSDFLTIRAALEEGAVGRVAHFESHIDRFRPQVRDRWRETAGPGAGLWFDLGPHLADQALQLFGLPDRVQADLALQRDGAQTDDWAHVVLHYGAMRVILHASVLAAGGHRRFVVHGDRGTLVKPSGDVQEAQLIAGMAPGAPGWGIDPDPLLLFDGTGGRVTRDATPGDQRAYYLQVAAAIREDAPNPVTPLQAIAVIAVIEAAFASARSGSVATLDLANQERAGWNEQPLTQR
jgi:predicted dehydrogenase